MAEAIQIVDWDELFETHNTRKVKRLELIYFRNKHDGDGYTEIVDHDDGAGHFGAWVSMCELHSRVRDISLRRSGIMIRDDGRPHDAGSLGRMTRMGREVFEKALPLFISVGWVLLVELNQQSTVTPPVPPGNPPDILSTPGDSGSPTDTNTKTNTNTKTLKTGEEKPDPLEPYPTLANFYGDLMPMMKTAFGDREFKPPKNDLPWRKTLADLVRLDNYSQVEVIDVLTWLYTREDQSGGFSWRRQAQSIGAIRKKQKGDSMTKFAKIKMEFDRQKGTRLGPKSDERLNELKW